MVELIPLYPETVYHIYNHANGDENIFRSDENYYYFLKKYAEYIYPIAETYAYCLMPNHFHLMVRIRSEKEVLAYLKVKRSDPTLQGFETLGGFSNAISKIYSNFFNAYAQAFNKMHRRRGSLFIPNFKRKPVYEDAYFKQLIVYIHLNPVKHGFCKHILDWEHSSMHAYYQQKNTKLNRGYLKDWLENKENIIAFHNSLEVNDHLFDFN